MSIEVLTRLQSALQSTLYEQTASLSRDADFQRGLCAGLRLSIDAIAREIEAERQHQQYTTTNNKGKA